MQVLFEHKSQTSPKLSIVLVDWSCRDSFHILDYLNKQAVSREQYEIIWIEYYNRRSQEIERALAECERQGKPPVVDKWIIMDMPDDTYYHKHLMYNVGIVASLGKIVCVCDSDAIVGPTFVESIINTFEKNNGIVLHLDEVRNINKRFYPFNYPSREEIINSGCINFKDGKTTGLLDETDPIHTRNYGACMCALRRDLIDIGGADEHEAYFGHICGPYDMTFRLVNAGKREIWHQKEFLYHTWHPGMDGIDNYLGPHDGNNMSIIALETRSSGRVLPLVENPAIKICRTACETILYDSLLAQCIPELEIVGWKRVSTGPLNGEYQAIPKSTNKTSKYVFLLLRILVVSTGLVLVAIWLNGDQRWNKLLSIFRRMSPLVFGATFGIFVVGQIILAFRWWLLLRTQSIIISFFTVVKLYFIGLFYNNFMPGSVGGDLIRAWYVTQNTNKRFKAALSVLVDRVIGLFSILLMASFFYIVFLTSEDRRKISEENFVRIVGNHSNILLWFVIVALVVSALAFIFKSGRIIFGKIFSKIYFYSAETLKKLYDAIVIYCSKPLAIIAAFGLTFFLLVLTITGFWILGRNIGIKVGLEYYYVFFTLTWVLGSVPISIGGVVVVEGLLAYMFINFAGVEPEAALALALCQRVFLMLSSLAGAVIHISGRHLPKKFSIDFRDKAY
ncbi:MAG: flippase-like domain-containing protein [Sedimentisphaerales bacterium]